MPAAAAVLHAARAGMCSSSGPSAAVHSPPSTWSSSGVAPAAANRTGRTWRRHCRCLWRAAVGGLDCLPHPLCHSLPCPSHHQARSLVTPSSHIGDWEPSWPPLSLSADLNAIDASDLAAGSHAAASCHPSSAEKRKRAPRTACRPAWADSSGSASGSSDSSSDAGATVHGYCPVPTSASSTRRAKKGGIAGWQLGFLLQ